MNSIGEASVSLDIILLAYNEVATIENEIMAWRRDVLSHFDNATIIVGEDGSSDGTTEVLSKLHNLGLIYHDTTSERRGYVNALLSALRRSKGDWVFFADTGNKFRAIDFWKLFNSRNQFDLVTAYRHPRHDQIYRRCLTVVYSFVIRQMFPKHQLRDADSGFRLYSRELIEYILSSQFLFKDFVTSEISIRATAANFSHTEIKVPYYQRDGKSRGIPTKSILYKSWRALRALKKLKREISN